MPVSTAINRALPPAVLLPVMILPPAALTKNFIRIAASAGEAVIVRPAAGADTCIPQPAKNMTESVISAWQQADARTAAEQENRNSKVI